MKRFVIEGFNHFIKDIEQCDLMKEEIKTEKLKALNNYRNAYISGLITEKEALEIMLKYS